MMLQAKSRHRDLRTLGVYTRPVPKQSPGSPTTSSTGPERSRGSGLVERRTRWGCGSSTGATFSAVDASGLVINADLPTVLSVGGIALGGSS